MRWKSANYSAGGHKRSVLQTLSRHQGEFLTKTEWCTAWKKENPDAPQSDRPGSFYVAVLQFEEAGKVIYKDGRFFVNT